MDAVDIMRIAGFALLMGYILGVDPEYAPGGLGGGYQPGGPTQREKDNGKRLSRVLVILVLVGSLGFVRDVIVGSTPFGTETIGGVLEKGSYEAPYYILAFPEAGGALNYKVGAEIHSELKYDGFQSRRMYEVESFQWPQGGTVTFNKLSSSGYSLEPDRIIVIRDDDGKAWGIQLTREKVLLE